MTWLKHTLLKLAYAINRDFLEEKLKNFKVVLKSTHNVCFGSKIRKLGTSLQTPVLLYKSGV